MTAIQRASFIAAVALLWLGAAALGAEKAGSSAPPDRSFLENNCFYCHEGEEAEASLDLTRLGDDLASRSTKQRWVRIFDRIRNGEMPPPDMAEVDPAEAEQFLQQTEQWLTQFQHAQDARLGRVRSRRLTRRELERSLQDLLGIDIPLASHLPEETASSQFSTVAEGQTTSHFQVERHLKVVDLALDEAFGRALTTKSDQYQRDLDAQEVARRPSQKRTREPEIIDGRAVVWSSNLIFYGRIPATAAPEDGWYRFKIRVAGLKLPDSGGVWSTVRSGLCVSSAPLMSWAGAFEAMEEPREIELEAWLPKRHMLEIRPGDNTLKKARFAGGQVANGEGGPQNVPGVAIEWIKMERFHRGPDDDGVRRLLFGDLNLEQSSHNDQLQVVSNKPIQDAARLLEQFARRAFRRPVTHEQIDPYVGLVTTALEQGEPLPEALRVGYRALLCSPRFMYLIEEPGGLDNYAIAARLSYMLTGSSPDKRLRQLAEEGRLQDPAVIGQETDRLLAGEGSRRFVQDFAAEWLDLDQIEFTEPDRKLYPDFDPIVQHSMLAETHTFLETMLRENVSVAALIDSDFTFLNSRLSRYYDIPGVEGDALRRFVLEPQHRRGGVLTQGAILKVTANGTNTSPVIRGVWVSERLLGQHIPPPPENVSAIEPDIRGAKTIRELLEKHRSQDSCASCHVKIDPPGFALENFDAAGRWREHYVRLDGRNRKPGAPVDASCTMPDGHSFEDVSEFQSLVADQPRELARNVAEKLLVFGTGAEISFADRQVVEDIVDRAANENYGFRCILDAVVTSPIFLNK